MHRNLLKGLAVDEQVVDPHGVEPLEEILGRCDSQFPLQFEEGFIDFIDEIRLDGVGQNGVPVLSDPLEMLGHVSDGAAAGGCHSANCRDSGPGAPDDWNSIRQQYRRVSEPGTNWPGG